MTNLSKLDLSVIDFRSLTPEQWNRLQQRIIQEAHQERAGFIRGAFGAPFSWLRDLSVWAWAAVFAPKQRIPVTRCRENRAACQ